MMRNGAGINLQAFFRPSPSPISSENRALPLNKDQKDLDGIRHYLFIFII